jgi:hypothetical protein
VIQSKAELWCEAAGKHEAPGHPGLLAAQELGDGHRGELVLIDKRLYNPGFVHGACGLPGSVGFEKSCLHGDSRNRLDHDGDLSASFSLPDDQALETIDNFVGAFGRLSNPNRHGSQVVLVVGVFTSEWSQGGA